MNQFVLCFIYDFKKLYGICHDQKTKQVYRVVLRWIFYCYNDTLLPPSGHASIPEKYTT